MELRDLGKDCTVERSRLFGALRERGGEDGLNWVDVYRVFSDNLFLFGVVRVPVRRLGMHDLLIFCPKR